MSEIQVTLAKALKLKNRLTGKLSSLQGEIQNYNSVRVEQEDVVNVKELFEQYDKAYNLLIHLKMSISRANLNINSTIIELGELKSKKTFFSCISTREGKETSYGDNEVIWVSYLKRKDIIQSNNLIEARIDQLQEDLDQYNWKTTIGLPEALFELLNQTV